MWVHPEHLLCIRLCWDWGWVKHGAAEALSWRCLSLGGRTWRHTEIKGSIAARMQVGVIPTAPQRPSPFRMDSEPRALPPGPQVVTAPPATICSFLGAAAPSLTDPPGLPGVG